MLATEFRELHADVLPSSFQGCVATSGAIAGSRSVSLQWIAYQTVSNGAYQKKVSIPMWTTGTECIREDFAKVSKMQVVKLMPVAVCRL